MTSMIVHLHASCWNEERMLPFFFRHYDPVVDHYIIHDNQSTDGSLDILAAHPRVTVRPLELEGDSVCGAGFELVNDLWKENRGHADWVALCNVDEFFWHRNLRWYLRACREQGITFLPTIGYDMVAEEFPASDENLPRTRKRGVRKTRLDKPAFFNPDAIEDSGFAIARHSAAPKGRVVVPEETELRLLHYKHLGREYVTARHLELNARRRPGDIENQWGSHYDPEPTRNRFDGLLSDAIELPLPVKAGVQRWIYGWTRQRPSARTL